MTVTGSTVPGIGEMHDAELLRGMHQYELSNHLGNVLATVTDRKTPHVSGSTPDYYEADVMSVQDYTPFGMLMVTTRRTNTNSLMTAVTVPLKSIVTGSLIGW